MRTIVHNALRIYEPGIYRSIIDDVIASIKSEFDEYGVGEDVLADLHAVCTLSSISLSFFSQT